jgi:hypothetical protein
VQAERNQTSYPGIIDKNKYPLYRNTHKKRGKQSLVIVIYMLVVLTFNMPYGSPVSPFVLDFIRCLKQIKEYPADQIYGREPFE